MCSDAPVLLRAADIADNAEAAMGRGVVGHPALASGAAAASRIHHVTAAAENAIVAGGVGRPLPGIAEHVTESVGVGFAPADRLRVLGVAVVPGILAQLPGVVAKEICRLFARTAGELPL